MLANLNQEAEEKAPQHKKEQKETISVLRSFRKMVNRVHCHDGEIVEIERGPKHEDQEDEYGGEDDDGSADAGLLTYAPEEVKIDLSLADEW